MKKIRILFADDHSIVRNGLRALFRSAPEFSIVGEASDGNAAIQLAATRKPHVAILDISMPKVNGIEAARIIKQKHPEIKILILTIHEDEAYVAQMVRVGANGYILKNAEKNEILTAVRAVANGERFFSPGISKVIIERFIQQARHDDLESPQTTTALTKREKEVLEHIAHGLTSREIAEKLYLSLSTVNTHRANLMQKLDIHDTAGLVRYAIQNGFVKIESTT